MEGYDGAAGYVPASEPRRKPIWEQTIEAGMSGPPGRSPSRRVAEMQREVRKHQEAAEKAAEKARRAQEYVEGMIGVLESLDAEADSFGDGTVLRATVLLNGKGYTFVILRAGGTWYSSGRRDVSLIGVSWVQLLDWLVACKVQELVVMVPIRRIFPEPELFTIIQTPPSPGEDLLRDYGPKIAPMPPPGTTSTADVLCTHGTGCTVHPGIGGLHNLPPNPGRDEEPPF